MWVTSWVTKTYINIMGKIKQAAIKKPGALNHTFQTDKQMQITDLSLYN